VERRVIEQKKKVMRSKPNRRTHTTQKRKETAELLRFYAKL